MKKSVLILSCILHFSCSDGQKEKPNDVNTPQNTVYLTFADHDTIRLNVLSYYEEQDSLFPTIHTAFVRAQNNNHFMRLSFPVTGTSETMFIGEYLVGDTLEPDTALFGLGIGPLVENSDHKLKAFSSAFELRDYLSLSNGVLADLFIHIAK